MPNIRYEKWTPRPKAWDMISKADRICQEYAAAGYDLTLRQLYYQFVARGYIANNDREYKNLGEIVNRARLAGYLDWDYITDRTRNLRSIGHFNDPGHIMEAAANSYRLDKWEGQPFRVEVWVEKEALAGVVAQAANRLDVPYFSCRGYVSQSEQWGAAQRLGRYIEQGQGVIILHLGDHDPSGIDMTRDIRERIEKFVATDWYQRRAPRLHREPEANFGALFGDMRDYLDGREPFTVNRIALNMDQVNEYDPPPNPAKLTDSRVGAYIEAYGDESWELDALPPDVLDALITSEIEETLDRVRYDAIEAREDEERALIGEASDRWDEVVDFLRDEVA